MKGNPSTWVAYLALRSECVERGGIAYAGFPCGANSQNTSSYFSMDAFNMPNVAILRLAS